MALTTSRPRKLDKTAQRVRDEAARNRARSGAKLAAYRNPMDFKGSVGGTTFANKPDYEAAKSAIQSGILPPSAKPEVSAAFEANRKATALRQAEEKLSLGALNKQAENQILLKKLGEQEAVSPKEELPTQEQNLETTREPTIDELVPKGSNRLLTNQTPEEQTAQFERNLGVAIEKARPILKPVAQVYDFVYSLFQGGKGIEQKEAESSWADVSTAINAGIGDFRNGFTTYDDIAKQLEIARQTNLRLAESTKSWSSKNLRYFITDGLDVETQVKINEQAIERWENELEMARQQSQINSLRANYGL